MPAAQDKKQETLLLVEDEAIIAMMEIEQLQREGYKVIHTPHGEDAIDIVCNKKIPVDLILMDVDLGYGMDGTDVAREIARDNDIPVVFLSSHTETEIVQKTEKVTSYGYVIKNSGMNVLNASIKMAFKLFEANRKSEEQKEQLRTILHSIGDAVIAADTNGRIIRMNPVAENLTGWMSIEAEGRPLNEVFKIIDAQTRMPSANPVDIVLASTSIVDPTKQWILISKKGNEYQIADSGSPIKDADGRIIGVVLVFRDVTQECEIRRKIEESEKRLASIFNTVGDCIFVLDVESEGGYRFASVNQMFLKVTGLPIEAIVGKRVRDIIPEPSLALVLDKYGTAIREKTIVCWEEITNYPKGRLSGEVSIAPIFDEEGNCIRLVGAVHDITERKRIEKESRDSRRMLQTILDSIPSAVFWKDRDSRYLGGNSTWLKVAGLNSPEEVVGKNDYDLPWTKEQADSFRKDDRRVISSGNPEYGIIEHYRRADLTDGWAMTNKIPLRDTEGEIMGVLGTYEDITERKLDEERIANLLNEKELILKEVHHRIKNDMNIILSLLSIQSDAQKNQTTRRILQDAASRVQSMEVLYDKLYRADTRGMVSIKTYLPTLIEEIVGIFSQEGSVRIVTRIEDIVLSAKKVSPLGIILNELITNAMKYAFPGGGGAITVTASMKEDRVSIVFEDNGCGIPESIAFENASGFGLQLVGLLVKQINGSIVLERRQGTKYTIEFPA